MVSQANKQRNETARTIRKNVNSKSIDSSLHRLKYRTQDKRENDNKIRKQMFLLEFGCGQLTLIIKNCCTGICNNNFEKFGVKESFWECILKIWGDNCGPIKY